MHTAFIPSAAPLGIAIVALLAHATGGAQQRAPLLPIPAEERAALVALYEATNGRGWKSASGWTNPDGTPATRGTECDWEGIECDDANRHVVSISLADNRLAGPLPRTLTRLRWLETLDLGSNALTGEIPRALMLLPRLRQLSLAGNALTGMVPPPPAGCALVSLDLSHNALAGAIPPALSSCTGLESLDLRGNRLSSDIPRAIGRLGELQFLLLGTNTLTGSVPREIAELSALKALDLSHNRLSGLPADGFVGLASLEYLNISSNQFAGPLPDLRPLVNLEQLIASRNAFYGALDGAQLPAGLTSLDLAHNQLGGELPVSLASLEDLQMLDLTGNQLTGLLPDLSRMVSLVALRAGRNRFAGDIALVRLPERLRVLDLSHNDVGGALPEALFESDEVRYVQLSYNRISGALPATLWQSESLEILEVSDNAIEGALPQNIEGLEHLRVLNLARNLLSGTVGQGLLGLPNLVSLDLSGNQLSGEVPRQARARGLQRIDLSYNRLSGQLPDWLSSVPALRFVGLSGNQLTGGLEVLVRSASLSAAALDANPWKGEVPPQLAALPSSLDPAFPLLDAGLFKEQVGEGKKEQPAAQPPPARAELPERPQDPTVQTTLVGRVRDETGAVIPGVTITLESRGLNQAAVSDDEGMFRFSVPPGTYRLTGELAGFMRQTTLVTASAGQAATVELTFASGIPEVVELSAGPPPEVRRGPWWNTWTTARGAEEEAAVPDELAPNKPHTFYLELSALERALSGSGIRSDSIDDAFRERLKAMLWDDRIIEPRLTFRFMVVGRAALLLESSDNVEVWSNGQWTSTGRGGSTATAAMRLTAVIGEGVTRRYGYDVPAAPEAARAGGLRFGIMTGDQGCAAVAVSIWDEALNMPLDSAVHVLQVGTGRQCPSPPPRAQAAIGLLRARDKDEDPPHAWLHTFEFPLPGGSKSASFMLLRGAAEGCPSYAWSSDATLSGSVLENEVFKKALVEARGNKPGGYAAVARRLASAVFPRRQGGECGSDAAWNALQQLAQKDRVTMYARLTDQFGQVQAVPLALLAMSRDTSGQPLFANDLRVIEPLPRETLSETACVSAWTFVLPPKLKGIQNAVPPLAWEELDGRVLRTRTDFEVEFVDEEDTEEPLGLVLLAHHREGYLTFTDDTDEMDYTQFTRAIGDGSIAVLSACETASLIDNGRLIGRLNRNGVDAIVTSPFVIDAPFGIRFATNFAAAIHELRAETTVADVFDRALSQTVQSFVHSKGAERARGLGLELVLAGNPRLRICPRDSR